MTRLLSDAIRRLSSLPPARQDELARVILNHMPSEQHASKSGPQPLPVGWLSGWAVPASFDDPLPDELVDFFEGRSSADGES